MPQSMVGINVTSLPGVSPEGSLFNRWHSCNIQPQAIDLGEDRHLSILIGEELEVDDDQNPPDPSEQTLLFSGLHGRWSAPASDIAGPYWPYSMKEVY